MYITKLIDICFERYVYFFGILLFTVLYLTPDHRNGGPLILCSGFFFFPIYFRPCIISGGCPLLTA